MRKVKAHIKTSPSQNLIFNVYRSLNPEEIPDNVDVLLGLSPIMEIDEEKRPATAHIIEDEYIDVHTETLMAGDYIPYSLRYEMHRSAIHDLKIHIKYSDSEEKIYTVKFNNDGFIISVTDEMLIIQDASNIVNLISMKLIGLHPNVLENSVNVKATYYTRVIEVVDFNQDQDGVNYRGPIPAGFVEPDLLKRNRTQELTPGTTVPFFNLEANNPPGGETYFYRLLARDNHGNFSDPSDMMDIYLEQVGAEVEYEVQVCNDIQVDNPEWRNTGIILENAEQRDFGRVGTHEFDRLGSILRCNTPRMDYSSYEASHSLDTDPGITLKFDNPWTGNKYRLRSTKAFRLEGHMKANREVSSASDIVLHEDILIAIDSLYIRRKEITNPAVDGTPCSIDGPDAETVGIFLKNEGLTHMEINSEDPEKINLSTRNTGKVGDDDDISLMTPQASHSKLTLIDKNTIEGKMYRYTVYLVDDFGTVSEPTSYDITFGN